MTSFNSESFSYIFVNEHHRFEEMSASVIRVEVFFTPKINWTEKYETLVLIYQIMWCQNYPNFETVRTPQISPSDYCACLGWQIIRPHSVPTHVLSVIQQCQKIIFHYSFTKIVWIPKAVKSQPTCHRDSESTISLTLVIYKVYRLSKRDLTKIFSIWLNILW
jgi:hypothetical protein